MSMVPLINTSSFLSSSSPPSSSSAATTATSSAASNILPPLSMDDPVTPSSASSSVLAFNPAAMFALNDPVSPSIPSSSISNTTMANSNILADSIPTATATAAAVVSSSNANSSTTTTTAISDSFDTHTMNGNNNNASTTMMPLMTTLGSGWRMFWYDHEREKIWKIGLPAFKQCKKKKIHYSSDFAPLWYKSPYKYDMVLEAKNIDDNTTAQIKLLFADNYEEVKSGSSSQKQTITKNQNHFQTTSASAVAAAPSALISPSSAITVGASGSSLSPATSKIGGSITTTGRGATSRNSSIVGEYDRSVHVGPFQLQVCSFKLERPVCMGIYLSIPSSLPDSNTPTSHEHSVCCLVSPVFTIKSKKPPQGGKRKKFAAGVDSSPLPPTQTQHQTTQAAAELNTLSGLSTPILSSASAGSTPKSAKRSRRSSRGLDNDEGADSSSDDDTSEDDDDEDEDTHEGTMTNGSHRKRRKAPSISTNGNATFASASTSSFAPTTPTSTSLNFSKDLSLAPGFQGIGATASQLASLSPRSQQLLKAEQNQLLSLINSDSFNLQNFEAKFDQMPQQQALDFLQFDYSLQQSNPVLYEDMLAQLTLQTASAADSSSANQIQSAILNAYGIPIVGTFDPMTGVLTSSSGSINSMINSGGMLSNNNINTARSNEILNNFETMSEPERHSLLVQLMDKLTIAEREVVRCKLDEYPRIPSAPPM